MVRVDARVGAWTLPLTVGSGIVALSLLLTAGVTTPQPERRVTSQAPSAEPWRQRLDAVDAAIARRDVTAAVSAWREAYSLAVATRRWEVMAEVGDTAVRMHGQPGFATAHPGGFRTEARHAYLSALFRARETGSTEGVLRVAEAFAALGDREMAEYARAMAKEQR
jgi:hypothetical protein